MRLSPSMATRPGPALIILAGLCVIPLFWLALTTLATEWTTAEYSHGPAIVLLAGYMFLHALRRVEPAEAIDQDVPAPVITLSLLARLTRSMEIATNSRARKINSLLPIFELI